ncbi:hypothetical protein AbraIFM66951_009088, partial [Aspergillus brasiliensis]
MAHLLLPQGHREKIWNRLPDLKTEKGHRTLTVGGSKFMLREDQVLKWTNFTQEVKYLVNRYCGNTHRFAPVMPPEIFAVANEVGVQGRFVENALNPVGE